MTKFTIGAFIILALAMGLTFFQRPPYSLFTVHPITESEINSGTGGTSVSGAVDSATVISGPSRILPPKSVDKPPHATSTPPIHESSNPSVISGAGDKPETSASGTPQGQPVKQGEASTTTPQKTTSPCENVPDGTQCVFIDDRGGEQSGVCRMSPGMSTSACVPR